MIYEKSVFGWFKGIFVKQCKEEKVKKTGQFLATYLTIDFLQIWYVECRVVVIVYIEDIKYVNLIEIGSVVIEIWGVENSELAIPVNNTLVHHMAFLTADTQLCVLIYKFGGESHYTI